VQLLKLTYRCFIGDFIHSNIGQYNCHTSLL